MKKFVHVLCSAIFWSWNLVFLLFIYVGFLREFGLELLQDALAGEIPTTILLSIVGLIVVPTLCTLVGWFRLRKHPVLLMRLFYGVEAPIFALCLLRLFIIRDLTPASSQILGTLGFCMLTFGIELWCGYAARHRALAWFQMLSHSLMLVTGVYVGTLLAFYMVPALCVFLYHFFQFQWLEGLWYILTADTVYWIWWGITSLLLFGLSCTLFFAMPFALVNMYAHSWWRIFSAFEKQYGSLKAKVSTFSVAIAWLLIFVLLQQQPQVQAFQLLDNPTQTPSDRQELLAKSDTIRAGLLNAYLFSYRYLSPWKESNQLGEMYRHVFDLSEAQAKSWQDFHNNWLSPFLYQGDRSDSDKATKLYAEFFDAPIQRAEQPAIQHALQSTVNRDEVQAGLLNINQKVVKLSQQRVTVHEQGDWAEVELYEQYQNPTFLDQEIFYSFSLPESAVITGLWLGDSLDRDQRFRFTVSPRGAAQQVYNAEVERANVTVAEDPALLEQVGPRQYRLRVFPIPAQQIDNQPGKLHLWMTYKVMRQAQGWALPQLAEKRNVFWTSDLVRRRNNQPVQLTEETWLEDYFPSQNLRPTNLLQATLPGGYRVSAKALQEKDYSLPQSKHIALVLDSSRSMENHKQALSKTFLWLDQTRTTNDVDLYLTASSGANPSRLDEINLFQPKQLTFYGSLDLSEMLQQFVQLQGQTTYDAIVVLTDEGSYELAQDQTDLSAIATSLWLVHLDGKLPIAYSDAVLQTLQRTKGGVSTDLADVLQRLATEAHLGQSVISVTDGYAWSVEVPAAISKESITTPQGKDEFNDFAPLAARQLILKLSREKDMTQIANLDAVHAIAKQTEIVTPYSSMLVLVNDRQRELLRQAEASSDRFEREIEDGQETLSQPNNPLNVASVPEPGTVIGVGVVAIALLLTKHRSRISPKA